MAGLLARRLFPDIRELRQRYVVFVVQLAAAGGLVLVPHVGSVVGWMRHNQSIYLAVLIVLEGLLLLMLLRAGPLERVDSCDGERLPWGSAKGYSVSALALAVGYLLAMSTGVFTGFTTGLMVFALVEVPIGLYLVARLAALAGWELALASFGFGALLYPMQSSIFPELRL